MAESPIETYYFAHKAPFTVDEVQDIFERGYDEDFLENIEVEELTDLMNDYALARDLHCWTTNDKLFDRLEEALEADESSYSVSGLMRYMIDWLLISDKKFVTVETNFSTLTDGQWLALYGNDEEVMHLAFEFNDRWEERSLGDVAFGIYQMMEERKG
jgi:hypothetical protein